jgi:hypothetical protein
MIALPLLAAAGATMGRHRQLQLKPGFKVLPVLFGAVVAPPGSAKTPALDAALKPIHTLQNDAYAAYQRHKQALDTQSGSAAGATLRAVLDHLYTTDATIEAIAPILVTSPGLLVHHDELVAWVMSCDQYRGGKGADRQHWLAAWMSTPIKVDRKTAETIFVPQPVVSVIGGIQPDVLPRLHNPDGARDGFVERVLWTYPETEPARWSTTTVAEATTRGVCDIFRTLRRPPARGNGVVSLDAHAAALWIDWYDENRRVIPHCQGLAAGFRSKLPVQVARLALIVHTLGDRHGSLPQLGRSTLEYAIALGEYFQEQFERIHPLIMRSSKSQPAPLRSKVETILREGQHVSRSELLRRLGGNVPAQWVNGVLDELESEGQVAKAKAAGGVGRPGEYWQWTPNGPPQTPSVGNDEEWRFF